MWPHINVFFLLTNESRVNHNHLWFYRIARLGMLLAGGQLIYSNL